MITRTLRALALLLLLSALPLFAAATVAIQPLLGSAGIAAPAAGATFTLHVPANTMSSATITYATMQGIVTTTSGNGSATILVQVSNDPLALSSPSTASWLTYATITLPAGASPVTDGITINAPWLYVRANLTAITGTGALAQVYMGVN